MLFSGYPVILLIWSGLLLKIFLVVSVSVLAIYIFVLESRYYFVEKKLKKLMKVLRKNRCDCTNLGPEFNNSFEARRLNILKTLWFIISILSIVLFFTYR
ncbi:MAG: hypothetical protein CVV56_08395 [Tenericutes bacterium HGW-Tenericutes-1]|jgi:hypothetical protein|nr:MAG: hypothetical protein CVV58_00110 [Tenericutes bacterium HGW-Tenericutes-3]PKK99961.1 MAG: hypothetical protein CVV56_08395 [Tenericutes bacterium HGW-Tenericutes-1]